MVKKANRAQEEFLCAGVRGEIELIVAVPDEYKVGFVNALSIQKGKEKKFCDPLRESGSIPDFLVLRKRQCNDLFLYGIAKVSDVSKGYYFDRKENKLILVPKSYRPEDLKNFSEYSRLKECGLFLDWMICHIKSGAPLEVTPEYVLFLKTQIDQFVGLLSDKKGNVGEYYKSDKLQRLNQAARIFWGRNDLVIEDSSTHPKTKDIEEWLINNCNFSKRMAEAAASILRPDFAARGRPPDE